MIGQLLPLEIDNARKDSGLLDFNLDCTLFLKGCVFGLEGRNCRGTENLEYVWWRFKLNFN